MLLTSTVSYLTVQVHLYTLNRDAKNEGSAVTIDECEAKSIVIFKTVSEYNINDKTCPITCSTVVPVPSTLYSGV